MKKLLALILSAVMLVSLFSACGNVEPEETTTATTTEATTEATTEVTTEATTEVTTETEASTTEATTETTAETTAETEPAALPATPESVWNGAEELYVCAVLGVPRTVDIDDSYAFCQYVKYFISDPEILEKVKSYLTEASLTATDQEGTFGRGSPNYCIGSSHERNFKLRFSYGTDVDSISDKTYVFCDGEKSDLYVMSAEGREYIGSIVAECAMGSAVIGTEYSDRSAWGVDSGERTFVTIITDSVKGFETELVDRFEFVYDVREQCILDGLSACLSPENMTEGSVLPGVEPTFSVEFSDGRIYKGYCFIGENGRLTVENVFFTETNGETEVFVLNEEACTELSELVESFSVMSATKWEIE